MVGETFAEYFLYRCGFKNDSPTWTARRFVGAKMQIAKGGVSGGAQYYLGFDPFEALPGWGGQVPPYFEEISPGLTGGLPRQYSLLGPIDGTDPYRGLYSQLSILGAIARRVCGEWNLETYWQVDKSPYSGSTNL